MKIEIQRLVFCPKENHDMQLIDCDRCPFFEDEDNYEIECSFGEEKKKEKES